MKNFLIIFYSFVLLVASTSVFAQEPIDPSVFDPTTFTIPDTFVQCSLISQSVETTISVSNPMGSSGTTLTFTGEIKNMGEYPLVGGKIKVTLLTKRNSIESEVDSFFIKEDVSLPVTGSIPFDFSWNVPTYALAGDYTARIDFVTNTGFILNDSSWANREVDFKVVSEEQTGVFFEEPNKDATPLILRASEKKDLAFILSNTTSKIQRVPVSIKLYKWNTYIESNLLETSSKIYLVEPNSTIEIPYVLENNAFSTYFVVAQAEYKDTKSQIVMPLKRNGVEEQKINFSGLTNFPLLKEKESGVATCINGDGYTKIVNTIYDKEGNILHQNEQDNPMTNEHIGVLFTFTPTSSYTDIILETKIFNNMGVLMSEIKQEYTCSESIQGCVESSDNSTLFDFFNLKNIFIFISIFVVLGLGIFLKKILGKKDLLVLFSLIIFCSIGIPQTNLEAAGSLNDFVTTWDTRITTASSSNSTSINIPVTGTGYSYKVDWNNDGDFLDTGETTLRTGSVTYDYGVGNGGIKTIRITGTFPRIYFLGKADRSKLLKVEQYGSMIWTSFAYAFGGCDNFDGTASDTPNLSNVTNMSYAFNDTTSFNGNIGNWNVSNVTDMGNMFNGAVSFNQSLNSWNTGNVFNMYGMFEDATSFNGDISNWNTSNVTLMVRMFYRASSFNQPIGNWNTSKVTTMVLTFGGATSFNQPLDTWNVSNVVTMMSMFVDAKAFNQPLNNWDTSKVQSMATMFTRASSFNGNIGTWNVGAVTQMSGMFIEASSFNNAIGNWNVSNVTNMANMFNQASSFNQPLNNWNTSSVLDFNYMFAYASSFNQSLNNWRINPAVVSTAFMFWGASSFNQSLNTQTIGGVIRWDMSNIVSTAFMFSNASSFNQSLSSWNVGKVSDMRFMFSNATSFNQSINSWNTISLIQANYMFQNATSFNQPLNNWNMSNAVELSLMFSNATSFNQPLDTWNVSNVTQMSYLFSGATSFNQPLNTWNVSKVNNMMHMFAGATSFNQPLSSWDTRSVKNMEHMFDNTITFNQNISSWNVGSLLRSSPVGGADEMFRCVKLSTANYNALLIGWDNQVLPSNIPFHGGRSIYSAAAAAYRTHMITSDNWDIVDGQSDSECGICLGTNVAPTTPVISAIATSTSAYSVTLTFGSTDSEGAPLTYEIDWGLGATTTVTSPASKTYTTPGSKTIKIRASDGCKQSAWLTQTIVIEEIDLFVNSFSASAACGYISLDWESNGDSYEIFRKTSGALEPIGTSPTSNYTDSNVTNGTNYSYQIRAIKGVADIYSGEISSSPICAACDTSHTAGQVGSRGTTPPDCSVWVCNDGTWTDTTYSCPLATTPFYFVSNFATDGGKCAFNVEATNVSTCVIKNRLESTVATLPVSALFDVSISGTQSLDVGTYTLWCQENEVGAESIQWGSAQSCHSNPSLKEN